MKQLHENKPDGAPTPQPCKNAGEGSAGTNSEQQQVKTCPHRYAGCISQNGYLCLHTGPCDPVDNEGRRFTVSYIYGENGERAMSRVYRKESSVIDANTRQAAAVMNGAAAAIQDTPFADVKPFDAERCVRDLVGS